MMPTGGRSDTKVFCPDAELQRPVLLNQLQRGGVKRNDGDPAQERQCCFQRGISPKQTVACASLSQFRVPTAKKFFGGDNQIRDAPRPTTSRRPCRATSGSWL